MAANPLKPIFFDANAFIDFGERLYPPDIFGVVWDPFVKALEGGKIVTCHRVLAEIGRATNPEPWRKQVHIACSPHAFDESSPDIQAVFGRLAGLVQKKQLSVRLSDTDLFVLACGETQACPIVTNDTKMINACLAGHVKAQTMNLPTVFRTLGWSFP